MRAKGLAVAVIVAAALVGPYVINCAIATGDPLYAINAHTVFYRAADGVPYDRPQSAAGYVRAKFASRPVATTDLALRGLVTQPFAIKWHGFEPWRAGLGTVLGACAAAGLVLWLFVPVGRLLLVLLFGSLVPYMVTWASPGGDAWRFSMHAYPIYLVAAATCLATVAAAIRQLTSDPGRWRVVQSRRAWVRVTLVLALLVGGLSGFFWSPYLVARESLLAGESTSVSVGPADGVFYGEGWSPLVRTGAVTGRLAMAERVTVHVPLPARRPYRLVMRLDPLPFADGRPQRVRVLPGRPAGRRVRARAFHRPDGHLCRRPFSRHGAAGPPPAGTGLRVRGASEQRGGCVSGDRGPQSARGLPSLVRAADAAIEMTSEVISKTVSREIDLLATFSGLPPRLCRQVPREQSERRHPRAHVIDRVDAGQVRQLARARRRRCRPRRTRSRRRGRRPGRPGPAPVPARTRGSPRRPTTSTRPITTLSTVVQNRLAYGSSSENGSTPRIDRPDHVPPAEAIAHRAADERAGRHGAEEREQVELRALHRRRRSGASGRTCSSC